MVVVFWRVIGSHKLVILCPLMIGGKTWLL